MRETTRELRFDSEPSLRRLGWMRYPFWLLAEHQWSKGIHQAGGLLVLAQVQRKNVADSAR